MRTRPAIVLVFLVAVLFVAAGFIIPHCERFNPNTSKAQIHIQLENAGKRLLLHASENKGRFPVTLNAIFSEREISLQDHLFYDPTDHLRKAWDYPASGQSLNSMADKCVIIATPTLNGLYPYSRFKFLRDGKIESERVVRIIDEESELKRRTD